MKAQREITTDLAAHDIATLKKPWSRRDFLRISGGAGVGLFFVGQVGGQVFRVPVATAAIPGGTLDPGTVPKFQTPLLIPPVMPRAG